jgi:hypothetical protein
MDALPEIVAGVDGYQISASSDQEAKKKGVVHSPNGIGTGSCSLLSARCYRASASKKPGERKSLLMWLGCP